jgi:hypothetical protein
MVGEGLPDHPADDRVVVHLLEGCVKAGREGKRPKQHVGVQTSRRWMDGWMDGWVDGWMNGSKIQSQLLMLI